MVEITLKVKLDPKVCEELSLEAKADLADAFKSYLQEKIGTKLFEIETSY